jgi:hypothetical protein
VAPLSIERRKLPRPGTVAGWIRSGRPRSHPPSPALAALRQRPLLGRWPEAAKHNSLPSRASIRRPEPGSHAWISCRGLRRFGPNAQSLSVADTAGALGTYGQGRRGYIFPTERPQPRTWHAVSTSMSRAHGVSGTRRMMQPKSLHARGPKHANF